MLQALAIYKYQKYSLKKGEKKDTDFGPFMQSTLLQTDNPHIFLFGYYFRSV